MKKILIADDRPEVVELVRVILEGEDYKIVDASNGKEALKKSKTGKARSCPLGCSDAKDGWF